MEDREYFDNYLDLFVSKGWLQFIEDNQGVLDNLDVRTSKNWDQHIEIKTELEVRELIASFEEGIRLSMEVEEEDDLDDDV
jgi:hypothetical protein